jgi:hypothetical protein
MSICCAACGQEISPDRPGYTLRLDLFGWAGPLEIGEDELTQDRRAELLELVQKLGALSAEQVAEQEDQVFERYTFPLCPRCREDLHGRLRTLRPRPSAH